MPKQDQELNNFTAGLHTDSTPLNSPQNTCSEAENFEIRRDGSLRKREGMEEIGSQIITTDLNFLYEPPALSRGASDFETKGALKVSPSKVMIYNPERTDPLSGVSFVSGTSILSNIVPVLDGFALMGPAGLHFFRAGDANFNSVIKLMTRDIWGVEDDLALTERPATLSVAHEYNLGNQGWVLKDAIGYPLGDMSQYAQVFSEFSTQTYGNLFPSNADQFALGADAEGVFVKANGVGNNIYSKAAPKGKYVIDILERGQDREAASGLTGLVTDSESGYFTTLAVYSGRVWVSGAKSSVTGGDTRSPNIGQTILFSQVVSNSEDIGKFYQVNDPTDPEVSDLLPTDGGVLNLPDIGAIIRMVPLGNGLLVIAEDSTRFITGPDGVFRADDFSVDVIANVGTANNNTIVNLRDTVMFANADGIYWVKSDPQSGRMYAENLTRDRISKPFSDFFGNNDISGAVYDERNNVCRWMKSLGSGNYRELIYDVNLNAFYFYSFDTRSSSYKLSSYLPLRNNPNGSYYYLQSPAPNTGSCGKLGSDNFNFFRDDFNGFSDYTATIVTGYGNFGDTQRDKWIPYITTHFQRSETEGFIDEGNGNLTPLRPSSCLMSVKWNFSDTGASGKTTDPQEIYKYPRMYTPTDASDPFDWGESVISTKNKVRGSGKVLQLKFESPAQKDCQLLGWGMSIYAGNDV